MNALPYILTIILTVICVLMGKIIKGHFNKKDMEFENPYDLIGKSGEVILTMGDRYVGIVNSTEVMVYSNDDMTEGDCFVITVIEGSKIMCKRV